VNRELQAGDVNLRAGELLRLPRPHAIEVTCESGRLWITEDARDEDVWLRPGERACLRGAGLVLIEAIGFSRVRVSQESACA
jgi:Protein of unknown function (DUF2917)